MEDNIIERKAAFVSDHLKNDPDQMLYVAPDYLAACMLSTEKNRKITSNSYIETILKLFLINDGYVIKFNLFTLNYLFTLIINEKFSDDFKRIILDYLNIINKKSELFDMLDKNEIVELSANIEKEIDDLADIIDANLRQSIAELCSLMVTNPKIDISISNDDMDELLNGDYLSDHMNNIIKVMNESLSEEDKKTLAVEMKENETKYDLKNPSRYGFTFSDLFPNFFEEEEELKSK